MSKEMINGITYEEVQNKLEELRALERAFRNQELAREVEKYTKDYYEKIHNRWFLVEGTPYSSSGEELTSYKIVYAINPEDIEGCRSYYRVAVKGFELIFIKRTQELYQFMILGKAHTIRNDLLRSEIKDKEAEHIKEMAIESLEKHFSI